MGFGNVNANASCSIRHSAKKQKSEGRMPCECGSSSQRPRLAKMRTRRSA
jgi:hypothetical protein